jgi:hypothetical protein
VLDHYSRGEDNGSAALELHSLGRHLFGGTHTAGVGAYTYRDPNEKISKVHPAMEIPSIVPISGQTDTAFVTRILEKSTLYSGFTAFILPERLHTAYLTYSANYMVRVEDRSSAHRLLMANFLNADLLQQGYCAFFPREALHQEESVSHYDEAKIEPLHQQGTTLRHQPLNLRPLRPDRRLGDALIVYKRIVLPFFPGLGLQTLTQIAEAEEDAFRRFNIRLSRAFRRLQTVDDWRAIEEVHDEIDEGVENVRRMGRRLAAMRTLRDVELGSFAVNLAFATQIPVAKGGMIAGIVGSATLLDLLRAHVDRRATVKEIKRDDFFVPWLMSGLAEDRAMSDT